MNKETLLAFKQALIDLLEGKTTLGPCGLCLYLHNKFENKRYYRSSYEFVSKFLNYNTSISFRGQLYQDKGLLSPTRIALIEELLTYIDNILSQEEPDAYQEKTQC